MQTIPAYDMSLGHTMFKRVIVNIFTNKFYAQWSQQDNHNVYTCLIESVHPPSIEALCKTSVPGPRYLQVVCICEHTLHTSVRAYDFMLLTALARRLFEK